MVQDGLIWHDVVICGIVDMVKCYVNASKGVLDVDQRGPVSSGLLLGTEV